jgi:streptogramin lyase
MKPCRILFGCLLSLLSLVSVGAWAQVATEFSAGITGNADLYGIAAGLDGNLWFTERGVDKIGRITPAGVITEFSAGITAGAVPIGITLGPDGNLWFTEQTGNRIGRITPLGVVTEFGAGITALAFPNGIAAGPDGNLWFTEEFGHRIGRITTAGVVTEFGVGLSGGARPLGITAGPDGNLWFTDSFLSHLGRITPAGVITEFPVVVGDGNTRHPLSITLGPDGNLWFTGENAIVRMTPAGVQTEFSFGGILLGPGGITSGPDGNLWFTEAGVDRIGRITPTGVISHFGAGISAGSAPYYITAGPDGNLWFTENLGNRIGRITTTGGPPVLLGAVSRKVHGGAGTFDLPLSGVATNPTTEPRHGPAHRIVLTFDKPIMSATATVTEGTAAAGPPTFSGNDVIVDLAGVVDQHYVTVSLTNVTPFAGTGGGSASVRIGFLLGDVNQNRVVSLTDLGLVNAQLAQPVTAANFLKDVDANGAVSLADLGITNANLTRVLPAP